MILDTGRQTGQNRELAALCAVAMAVSHSLDLDNIIRETIAQVMHVTAADVCGIYLRDARTDDLTLAAIEGVSETFAQDPDIVRIPADAGWWGQMLLNGEPIILEDTTLMNRPSLQAVIREGLHSTVYVPLRTREHISGAIVFGSRRPRRFSSVDLQLLVAIGRQVGIAVENARLFEMERARVHQLTVINRVSRQLVATLDVDQLLERVVTVLHTEFGYQHASILFLNAADETLELKAAAGDLSRYVTVGEYRQPVSNGVLGRCARTGQVVLVNDVTRDPDYFHFEGMPGQGSELCVPLKSRGRVLGVLEVESDQVDTFDENDVMVIQTLADQLDIALEKAWLFQTQEQQLARLQTLHEIARTLTGTLNLDETLDRILAELERVVTYDSASVMLIEGNRLHALAARRGGRPSSEMEITLPIDDPLFQEAQRTGRPVVLQDAQADPRFRGVGDTSYVRGWVCAPLMVKERVIGCLTVDSREVGAYDEEDAQMIMTFARHAAVALENARLYAQTRRQVETLEALQETAVDLLSRLKVEEVLEGIVRRACELVGSTGGGIYLYNPEAEQLIITVSQGIAEDYVGRTLKPGEGLAGRVIQTGQPMWIDDYAAWEGRPAGYADAPFRAAISVPLQYRRQVLGALFLAEDKPGRTFNEQDAQLLSLFAAQAALALENARLYEKLERLAIHDGLTGLYNHRHFHELLRQEVVRAGRYNHPVALLIMDLDGFKAYNDRYGHVAGDEALRGIAKILRNTCRQGDLVARYGGEEFAVILPETPVEEAVRVAERVRRTVEQRTQYPPFYAPLTVSIGVASYPEHAGSASELLITADGMMYGAKARGKNQVMGPRS